MRVGLLIASFLFIDLEYPNFVFPLGLKIALGILLVVCTIQDTKELIKKGN